MKLLKLYYFSILFITTFNGNAQKMNKGVDSITFSKAKQYYQKVMYYSEKTDFEKVEKYTDSLYTFSKKHKLKNFELLGLMNMGVLQKNKGELKKALHKYSEILEECETLPKDNLNYQQIRLMTMQNMAGVYGEIGSYNKSVEILKKALTLAEKQKNNSFILGAILSNLSSSYSMLNDFDKSIEYQKKVLALAKKENHTYLIIHSLVSLSDKFRKKGDFKTALLYAKEAHKRNTNTTTEKHKEDWVFLRTGLAFQGLKQLDSAKYYLLKAKKQAIALKRYEVEVFAEENLAKVYEELKDYENAQKSQKRFNELNTQRLNEIKDAEVFVTQKEAEVTLENVKEKNKNKTTYIVVSSLIIIAFLGGFLVQKNKLKKKTELENRQLQIDFKQIQNKYTTLKESMLQLSKDKKQSQNVSKYKSSSLKNTDRERYMNVILEFMDKKKPYLNPELTQAELAESLQINTHHLSEVLALSFGQNFNNFINFYRINSAQELLKNLNYTNYKVEAIGYEAGFNSKASFNRVFKNITGTTPSQYRKQQLLNS